MSASEDLSILNNIKVIEHIGKSAWRSEDNPYARVCDILKELECPQIVIVSHEKELESFADQVYKVTNVNGASSVGS